MREIKFRVWDKEDKKFVKPCFDHEEDRYNKGTAMIRWNSKGEIWFTLSGYRDEDGNPYEIDAEVMQYTGLKDKNGKEIYEGDVVKCYGGEFAFGFWQYSERITIKDIFDILIAEEFDNIEVIGNIYENPELLEVGNV